MRYQKFLWVLPFVSFLCGYQLLRSLYTTGTLKTPTIVGKNLQDAVKILSDYNLNPRILAEKEDADLQAGTIITQTPSAGSSIKPNQPVFIVIATKTKQCTPDVVGKNKISAQEELKKCGLMSTIHPVESSYPTDYCIGQNPVGGEPLDIRNPMLIYSSSGKKKPVLMPQFKHRQIQEVITFLEQQGMSFHIIHTSSCPDGQTCKTGLVIDQRPLPGSVISLNPEKPLNVQLQVSH